VHGGLSNQPELTARQQDDAERIRRIAEWRREARSYRWIGEQIGLSRQRVEQIWNAELQAIKRPAVEQAREEAIQRYEGQLVELRVLAQAESAKQEPDVTTLRQLIDSMAKIQARLDKLQGLEAPVKVQQEVRQTVEFSIRGVDVEAL
jgi:hypothetical protein